MSYFLKKLCLVFVSAITCHISIGQLQWPAVKQETKPWARWWWEGSAVDKKNLTGNLEDYKLAGLGGLEPKSDP